jgi:hypothetical protein
MLCDFRDVSDTVSLWVDALCIYPDRYRSKYFRKLRFEPLFCEGGGFAYFACPAHT